MVQKSNFQSGAVFLDSDVHIRISETVAKKEDIRSENGFVLFLLTLVIRSNSHIFFLFCPKWAGYSK